MSDKKETLAYLCSSWNMEEKEVMFFFEDTFKDFLPLIEEVKVAGDAVKLYETWEKDFNDNGEKSLLDSLIIFSKLDLITAKSYEGIILLLDYANRFGVIDLDCSHLLGDKESVEISQQDAQSSTLIHGTYTRNQLIDAMVNEWIVNCYCVPEEGDAPPEQMRREYEAMTNSQLLDATGCDETYTIDDYVARYQEIPEGYRKAFNSSVDDLAGKSESERSFIERAVSAINRLKGKLDQG